MRIETEPRKNSEGKTDGLQFAGSWQRVMKIGLMALLVAGVTGFGFLLTRAGSSSSSSDRQTSSSNPSPQKHAADVLRAETLANQNYRFPDGGRILFPDYRLVALYGSPRFPELGALGQQDASASIKRVKKLSEKYQTHTRQRVLPAFEIIATVAADSPTENGDYSRETPPEQLKPWAEAAKSAGVYVVLDLQPGRSHFLKQAKAYESLLKLPNVGLALDPEWRLEPHQIPLEQIGSAETKEINQTAAWLAKLTRKYNLPQKLFLLHQFRLDMIANRHQLDASHKELAYVIQMDGQGTQAQKADTWRAITANPPEGVRFGWKNFYKEDKPILSPQATMAVKPHPWYVSYQ